MDQEMRNKRKQPVAIDLNSNPSSKRVYTEGDLSAACILMHFQLVENEELGYEGDRDNTDEEEEDFDNEKLSDFEADEDRMCHKKVVVASTSGNEGRRKSFLLALHFLCAVQNTMFALLHSNDHDALNFQGTQSTTDQRSPSFSLYDILEKLISLHHVDLRILVYPNEPLRLPLETLTRGALLTLSFGPLSWFQDAWAPLTLQDGPTGHWSWVGPITKSLSDPMDLNKAHLTWGVSKRVVNHYAESFEEWLDIENRHLAALDAFERAPVAANDMVDTLARLRRTCGERFTVPSSFPAVRARFQEEERIRYTIPERAFYYTALDGVRSMVPPVFNSKEKIPRERENKILRADRPKGVTICSVVKDASARLPYGEGTVGDVCVLLRDTQYQKSGIDDDTLRSVVTDALHTLQQGEDPSVMYAKAEGVWRYLHRMRSVDEL